MPFCSLVLYSTPHYHHAGRRALLSVAGPSRALRLRRGSDLSRVSRAGGRGRGGGRRDDALGQQSGFLHGVAQLRKPCNHARSQTGRQHVKKKQMQRQHDFDARNAKISKSATGSRPKILSRQYFVVSMPSNDLETAMFSHPSALNQSISAFDRIILCT
jgi:hypothetical protein